MITVDNLVRAILWITNRGGPGAVAFVLAQGCGRGIHPPRSPLRAPSTATGDAALAGCGNMDRVSMEIEQIDVADLPDDFTEVTDRVLLDVREDDEWELGHVRGALHIPLNDVPARIDELDLDAELYVVCRTSGRSFRILQYLAMRGVDGTCVRGGMVAWEAAGRPIETGLGS